MTSPENLCDLNAEKALLGAMLMRADSIDEVTPIVASGAFSLPVHGKLFDALVKLHQSGKPMDSVVVLPEIHRSQPELMADLGGMDYLMELSESFGDTANAVHYAGIVRDKHVRRRLWSIGTSMARRACDELSNPDADSIVATAWKDAEDAIHQGRDNEVEAVDSLVARLPEWMRKESGSVLPTGFAEIDRRIEGFPRPGYVILAARPSVGKTSLGLAFALNVVKRSSVAALFVSLETPRMRIAGRVFSIDTGYSLQTWRDGDPEDFHRTTESFYRRFEAAKLYVTDQLFGISQIIARARSMIRTNTVGLIVIDYLQLVGGEKKAENRNLEIQAISRSLRMLANMQGVTVLALCQLNREAVSGQRPGLHHLRESGAIEQDADQVFFIYHGGNASQVCIDVAKNRDGALGSWTAKFRGDNYSFSIDTEASTNDYQPTSQQSDADSIPF